MFNNLLSLDEIKKEPYVIEHIRWDIEPRLLMERTTGTAANGKIIKDTLMGYVFYIDNIDKNPVLSLMRHTAADYAETLARIEEIPEELLKEAMEDGKDRVYFSMYPINKKIENWLKKELGVAAD